MQDRNQGMYRAIGLHVLSIQTLPPSGGKAVAVLHTGFRCQTVVTMTALAPRIVTVSRLPPGFYPPPPSPPPTPTTTTTTPLFAPVRHGSLGFQQRRIRCLSHLQKGTPNARLDEQGNKWSVNGDPSSGRYKLTLSAFRDDEGATQRPTVAICRGRRKPFQMSRN